MSERLVALRRRLGLVDDASANETSAKAIAVGIAAAALDLVGDGLEENYPDAITRAVADLPMHLRMMLTTDVTLRIVTLTLVSGMMDCLTTEWHR